jgi:predicted DNA-binding protein
LHSTTARLDQDTDDRLTAAVEHTGKGVQDIWEAAINFLADQHGILKKMPAGADLTLPRPIENRTFDEDTVKATVRLTRNTRARLAAAASRLGLGGSEAVVEALNAWFDQQSVPGEHTAPERPPTRHFTKVMIKDATSERLGRESKRLKRTAQSVVEESINRYASRHGVPETMPVGSPLALPKPGRPNAHRGTVSTIARLTENTRARLVSVCERQSRTAGEVIDEALNEALDYLETTPPA